MPSFPQKIILTNYQREVILHRLSHLWGLHEDDLIELYEGDESDPPLDNAALLKAVEDFYPVFSNHKGHLLSLIIENAEQGEILAECLEGSTYFATWEQGDKPYRHAAKAAAELLSTVLNREVEAHIDPVPPPHLRRPHPLS